MEDNDGKGYHWYWLERLDGELMKWDNPKASYVLAVIEYPADYIDLFDTESWVKEAKKRHKL